MQFCMFHLIDLLLTLRPSSHGSYGPYVVCHVNVEQPYLFEIVVNSVKDKIDICRHLFEVTDSFAVFHKR